MHDTRLVHRVLLMLLILAVPRLWAAEVQLQWDAVTLNADGSALEDLAGYAVYAGTASGLYGPPLVVGTNTSARVDALTPGVEYFFAVTAFDLSGNESDYSNEVRATPTEMVQTLVLLPTQDTFINLDKVSYRIEPTLNTYTWPDHQVANAILMKFNLSSLPATALLESAVLSLWQVESDHAGGLYRVSVHQVIGVNPNLNQSTGYRASSAKAWKANRCCYQRIPMAQENIGQVIDAQDLDSQPIQRTWLVTELMDTWRAQPTQNFGLLLNSDATQPRDRWRTFASREHPTAGLRPALTLTYTLP